MRNLAEKCRKNRRFIFNNKVYLKSENLSLINENLKLFATKNTLP